MKIQHPGVSLLGIAAVVAIVWPQWLGSANGCTIDTNCLPLRAQLINNSYRGVSVNRGESVTITCRTDCGSLNLTGCNVTDDWTAIATDASGNINKYEDIKHTSRIFKIENGLRSVVFSRSITQSGICNGTLTEEQFRVTVNIGNNPSFSTILMSCGLGRFGPRGYEPYIKAHDFSAVFRIDLNQPEEVTPTQSPATTALLPTTTPAVITATTLPVKEDKITVFSDDFDQQPLLKLTATNNSVNITCTKTNGSISELKVKLVDDSGRVTDDSELLYTNADNREQMNSMGIDIREADSYTEGGTEWQNFEIVLSNIQVDMIMQCGARATNNSEPVFYDHITVSLLPVNTAVEEQLKNVQRISISLGVILLIVLAIISVTAVVITIIIRKYYVRDTRHQPRRRQALQRHQRGLALNDPYFNIASHPLQELSQRIAEQDQPSLLDLESDDITYSYS